MAKRTAKKINIENFKNLISDFSKEGPKYSGSNWNEVRDTIYSITETPKIESDLGKIAGLPGENVFFEKTKYDDDENESLLELNTLENGLIFCGGITGGDWEQPVFFIIYHDGKEFRAYIPKDGNPYNTDTKSPYGNDEEADEKNFNKRFPHLSDPMGFDVDDCMFEWDKIKQDILNRFEIIETKEKEISGDRNPRLDIRPSWDQYFVGICEMVKERSLDPDTQVGCVIVDEDNRIISTGYNSWPRNCEDENIPHTRPSKYNFVLHSELNAIISCGKDLTHCTLYIPFLPCPECIKAIIAAKIKYVKYYGDYVSGVNDNEHVIKMAEMAGVRLMKIDVKIPKIIWN